jgi:lipopolysaccharide assembly protein A
MTILRNVVALLALALLLFLALTNAAPVKLSAFGYQTPELPLFVFLLVFFALGYLLAALAGAVRQTSLRRQVARLERDLAQRSGPGSAGPSAGHDTSGGN